ncbi:2-succinyl-5-enolpyruvyl-6-hydroxy-3-cyclohexene-1-carboxylic-acid synthase [Brachybacterium sp. J153]|uniref:2-succinyl-5-enolpyruvyl-6-hydroxy-3- cyclohexene-1-carboxylic-acid synthase n=1 Tax=Brachybacterium sp. J153 TaxID=3116488 RepID=UPI002E780A43|nr:2-succinyl-5-enolpyruvyl-6-hydroxy-3-cyclohexene-1-carboxylic-acid synthase [Brachybacterium sp. J153]MEE1618162.1 2-succinyl-5-enolpyruvyl-6-hydroxy-3-cyclohexene-1-carboxylic-acid synthase [Brachybacterium sp. J153]
MPEPRVPDAVIPAPVPTGSGAVDAATALWTALAELGVREAVLAPGSRSAPLVYALAAAPIATRIRAHVRIDERAAAFTALGVGRHDAAHPAAVFTTSGTAAAHLLAAAMEAHHSRIPLLLLTADRPAELRGTGANQTTVQTGLFSPFVRFRADLPAPTAAAATDAELRTVVSTLARAHAAATGEHPGPVHVNLGFRDPLTPRPEQAPAPGKRPSLVLTRRLPAPAPAPQPVPVSSRTVVVAGDGAGPAARALAEEHDLPLLAEPSSGARGGDSLVVGYPALLAEVMADPQHPLRPERAIVLGHPTLSRPVLGGLLGAEDVEVIVVDRHPDFADAARRARLVVPAARGERVPADGPSLRDAWQRAAAERFPAGGPTWQARAALTVWEASGAEDVLVLGSSSLVRDLDQHAGPTAARVLANRGLAGIDGTVSLAGGLSLARRDTPGRVRVLLGDLTALHDLTGQIIGPEEVRPDLDVIVVDDDGGRIFGGLEHAAAPPEVLRRFFTTPHGTDLAAAARALGAEAHRVDVDSLRTALVQPAQGLRVLVVREGSAPDPRNT